jgi:hypothetical protein
LLQLAYGFCKEWNKVAVIYTENHSGYLYLHLGDYNVLNTYIPLYTRTYIEAFEKCESVGKDMIELDNNSHEMECDGGILDNHSQMFG